MKRTDSNRKTLLILFFVLAGLLILRCCAYGLSYYPQLDDYIQYHNYRQSPTSFWEMAQAAGLLASRPLANMADYFIWSPLFDHMLVGVALVSGLYAACVGMVWSLLRRYFPVGPVFPVVTTHGCYIVDGVFTDAIPAERQELFDRFLYLQYYWTNEFIFDLEE